MLRLAIVGAGPSAFYGASRLLGRLPDARVHMFDRLWAPHGLVRYGVAPDHPEVKNCTHKFDETARDTRFRFFGNVAFQTRRQETSYSATQQQALLLPLSSLFKHYTHILLAHGAGEPISLKGLDPSFTNSALELVHWYTGHPLSVGNIPPVPLDTQSITIIGHGNVSLDIARLLLSSPSPSSFNSLASRDIPSHVLSHLQSLWHSLKHINIISRRGPAQVAFTAKELREMMNLEHVSMRPIPSYEFDGISKDVITRQQGRLLDLMRKGSKNEYGTTQKTWSLEFFRSPISSHLNDGATQSADTIKEIPEKSKRKGSITFGVNVLDEQGRARSTGAKEDRQTDLVITSLGYRSEAFLLPSSSSESAKSPQAELDEESWYDPILGRVRTGVGVVPSSTPGTVTPSPGQVYDAQSRLVTNVFASGWAARGARGVLASTMYDAYAVADGIAEGYLAEKEAQRQSHGRIDQSPFEHRVFPLASTAGIMHDAEDEGVPGWLSEIAHADGKRITTYDDWRRIDAEEVRRGRNLRPPKEKERFVEWRDVKGFLEG